MIALVRGTVAARGDGQIVVEAGGVGYALGVSAETLRKVPPVGEEVALHAHLVMRDDALRLFGFASGEERELFLMLVTVQGVGPQVALAVLSGGAPRDLLAAIAAGDAARFQTVKGIGKRTAERIIVELRERVVGAVGDGIVVTRGDGARAQAREGLVGLGFAPDDADRLLDGAEGETPEELVTAALKASR